MKLQRNLHNNNLKVMKNASPKKPNTMNCKVTEDLYNKAAKITALVFHIEKFLPSRTKHRLHMCTWLVNNLPQIENFQSKE